MKIRLSNIQLTKAFIRNSSSIIASLCLAACSGGASGGSGSGLIIVPSSPPPPPPPVVIDYGTREYRNNYGLDQIHAIVAYEEGATGAGITVAVIDSGIDVDNSDIVANIHTDSINIVTGNKADLDDKSGHGTGVAGVIAAVRDPLDNTNVNTHGVAFEAEVMAINAASVGSCVSVDGCSFFDSNIAAALDYARVRGVKIVNISLGGDSFNSPTLVTAYQRAVEAGMIIILAAGNRDDTDTDFNLLQPENSAAVAWEPWANGQIIVAGGVDEAGVIGDFSHKAGDVAKDVFLVAGGLDILSIGIDENGAEAFFLWTGTSFSAPHISGAVALLMSAFPNLTGKEVADLLFSTATDLGALGADAIYGRGLINLEQAFAPQGAASIAVRNVVGETTIVSMAGSMLMGGSAFGGFSALSGGINNSMMLDDYNRSYRVDLGQHIFDVEANVSLEALLGSRKSSRNSTLQLNKSLNMKLSWQEDWRFQQVDDQYFSYQNTNRNRYHNLRMKLDMTLGADLADQQLTFTQGLSLKEAMEDYDQDEFLTIGKEDFMALSGRGNVQNIIYGYRVNEDTHLALAIQHGGQSQALYNLNDGLKSDSYMMMARLDHNLLSLVQLKVDFGLMEEQGSVLGSLSSGAVSLGKRATTVFVNGRFDWSFSDRLALFTKASYGRTAVKSAELSLVETIDGLSSMSFSLGIMGQSLFQRGDRLSLAVSQPLRVIGGHANIAYVTNRNYTTDSLSFISNLVSLQPNSQEIDFELAYGMADIFGVQLDLNIIHQINPGHSNSAPTNTGFLLRFASEF